MVWLTVQHFAILVVDDFLPFREVICRALSEWDDIVVIGQASDGLEAVEKAESFQPDLILLDIGLPKLNGIEAARKIRKVSPNSKILFCSLLSSPTVVAEALRLGASGYLLKSDAPEELLQAVQSVLEGGHFVSSNLRRYQPDPH